MIDRDVISKSRIGHWNVRTDPYTFAVRQSRFHVTDILGGEVMVNIVARIGHNVLLAALAFVTVALFVQVL